MILVWNERNSWHWNVYKSSFSLFFCIIYPRKKIYIIYSFINKKWFRLERKIYAQQLVCTIYIWCSLTSIRIGELGFKLECNIPGNVNESCHTKSLHVSLTSCFIHMYFQGSVLVIYKSFLKTNKYVLFLVYTTDEILYHKELLRKYEYNDFLSR